MAIAAQWDCRFLVLLGRKTYYRRLVKMKPKQSNGSNSLVLAGDLVVFFNLFFFFFRFTGVGLRAISNWSRSLMLMFGASVDGVIKDQISLWDSRGTGDFM